MKKITALLLAFIMMLTLVSCSDNKDSEKPSGDDENPTIDAQKVVDKALEKAEEFDSFSVEAVEHFLSKAAGIKLSSIEPKWEYTVSKYGAYADDPSSGYGHAVIQFVKSDGETTKDEYNEWLEKVFDATAKASQDGYNVIGYEFAGKDENALDKTTLEDATGGLFMNGWAFKYNDKLMVVYVSREYDNNKKSELGSLFYYNGFKVDIGVGLQKSFSDTMDEAESYLAENEDEIKDALRSYLE